MLKINDKIAKFIFLTLLCVTAGFFGGYFAYENTGQLKNDSQTVLDEENYISSIVERVGEGVVSISIRSNQVNNTFFGPQNFENTSAGTGFIISEEGYVVTNRHVIPDGSNEISITLSNGETLEDVSVVDRTKENDPMDVAFLKINDSEDNDLRPVDLGSSDKSEVGDRVVAIGNALGQLQNTATSGIISGFGRDVTAGSEFDAGNLVNLIQTDAAINQGNSGGPLINARGEVIGIITAVAGGDAQNIGFAIPIDDLEGSIKSILQNGELKRPFLGVRYVSLTNDIAEENNLSVDRGAYLINTSSGPAVIPGSAADKAGLMEGDIIIAVDDTSIDDDNSITSALSRFSSGDNIELKIQRGEQQLYIQITLQEF